MRGARLPLALAASTAASLLLSMPAAATPQTHVIFMAKMKFGSAPAKVRPGDTILWVNRDPVRHTATAADKSFDVDLPAGAAKRIVVRKSGTFSYICKYHPGMRGVVRVTGR